MKKLLAIVMSVCLLCSFTACGGDNGSPTTASKAKQVTIQSLVDDFQAAGIPVDNVIVYTAETDVNKMLGRPNQYIAKVNFADTTLDQYDKANPAGGTIEQFNNETDLKARKEYIEKVTKGSPALGNYTLVKGNFLLRLSTQLTPDQAKKYEDIFTK